MRGRWQLSCLSVAVQMEQTVLSSSALLFLSVCISVHLCCASHSGSRCRNPVTALSAQNQHPLTVPYMSFHASKTRPCTYFHIHNICKHMIVLILAGSYFRYVHPTRMAAAVICFCFDIYGLPPFWRLTRSADSGQNPGGVFLNWARTETGQKFYF